MLRFCLTFVLILPTLSFAADRIAGPVDVIDADTWDVGGVRVRLFGIDAPELDQTCGDAGGGNWSCGAWATHQVRQLFQGKTVSCTPLDRDRYGRIVARCKQGRHDVAERIVRRGLAFAYRKYSDDYWAFEQAAQIRRTGLHAARVQAPWVHRSTGRRQSEGACRIKGNISSRGEKIYHVPGQKYYAKTRISKTRGERWFCTPAQARAAGWRAARR